MDVAPPPQAEATRHRFTYGRRKQIPLLLGAAALAAFFAVTTRYTVTRVFECSLLVLIAWRAYRYWIQPMTPRYAAATERRKQWREHRVSPKLVVGVVAGVVLFYAALFVAILHSK